MKTVFIKSRHVVKQFFVHGDANDYIGSKLFAMEFSYGIFVCMEKSSRMIVWSFTLDLHDVLSLLLFFDLFVS